MLWQVAGSPGTLWSFVKAAAVVSITKGLRTNTEKGGLSVPTVRLAKLGWRLLIKVEMGSGLSFLKSDLKEKYRNSGRKCHLLQVNFTTNKLTVNFCSSWIPGATEYGQLVLCYPILLWSHLSCKVPHPPLDTIWTAESSFFPISLTRLCTAWHCLWAGATGMQLLGTATHAPVGYSVLQLPLSHPWSCSNCSLISLSGTPISNRGAVSPSYTWVESHP